MPTLVQTVSKKASKRSTPRREASAEAKGHVLRRPPLVAEEGPMMTAGHEEGRASALRASPWPSSGRRCGCGRYTSLSFWPWRPSAFSGRASQTDKGRGERQPRAGGRERRALSRCRGLRGRRQAHQHVVARPLSERLPAGWLASRLVHFSPSFAFCSRRARARVLARAGSPRLGRACLRAHLALAVASHSQLVSSVCFALACFLSWLWPRK